MLSLAEIPGLRAGVSAGYFVSVNYILNFYRANFFYMFVDHY